QRGGPRAAVQPRRGPERRHHPRRVATIGRKPHMKQEQQSEITGENPAYVVVSAAQAKAWNEQAAKAAEAQDKAIRTLAEWDNSRKRMAKDKEDAIRFANQGLLEDLLPVVDNFELGMQAAANATDAKSIAVGLQMVLGQLQ